MSLGSPTKISRQFEVTGKRCQATGTRSPVESIRFDPNLREIYLIRFGLTGVTFNKGWRLT